MRKRHIVVLLAMTLSLVMSGCEKTKSNDATATDVSGVNTGVEVIKADKLTFSQKGGVYAEGFELTIEAKNDYTIFYTLDGSNPLDSETAVEYTGPIKIEDKRGGANVVSAVDPDLFCSNYSNLKDGKVDCYIQAPSDDVVDKGMTVRAIGINKKVYKPGAQAVAASEDGNAGSGELYIVPGLTEASAHTYFIGKVEDHIQGIRESVESTGRSLAVVNISMNYDDLFDYDKGIYVRGRIFDEELELSLAEDKRFSAEDSRKIAANYNQRGRDWERAAHVEFYEATAEGMEQRFSQDCGIRVQGNYSRSDLQKGFRLYARKDYGDNNFRYDIFGDEAVDMDGKALDKYSTLVLRAGGNCAFTSKYNDTYWQQLAKDTACATKSSRACVVYLNGEYWGLYVLEEDYSDDYFEDHYGVNKDEVVLYKGDAETYKRGYKLDLGDLPADEANHVNYYWEDFLAFLRSHDSLAAQADYDELAKMVDVESVIDYFAVEVWINNKWDWPGKNWSMWKTKTVDAGNPYSDGKWRFCLYDIEFGGVSGGGDAYTNTVQEDNYKPEGLLDLSTTNPAVKCFALFMTNEGFNDRFCARLQELSKNELEKTKALAKLDSFEGEYGPLFEQFFNRYPGSGSKEDALYGGYASSKCIRDFLDKRADHIEPMIKYCQRKVGK